MTSNNKRRPRHERVDEAQRPPFRLNDRDALILKFINDCRALTTQQVEMLFFKSAKPAYGRLHKLYHHEYVERQFITQVVTAPAASRVVYTIAPLGAAVLAQTYGYSPEDIHPASRQVRRNSSGHSPRSINASIASLSRSRYGPSWISLVM